MNDLNAKLKQDNTLLGTQLERCRVENKRLSDLLDAGESSGLTNDEVHQFNNVAALLDANIELALDSILKLSCGGEPSEQVKISAINNFLTAAQSARTELVDIVNVNQG